ncbi:MAG: type II/IV secretion system ATPase subunit [Pyrodictiaceae archaeon]
MAGGGRDDQVAIDANTSPGEEFHVLASYSVFERPNVTVLIVEDKAGRRFYRVEEPLRSPYVEKAYRRLMALVTSDLRLLRSLSELEVVEEGVDFILPYAKRILRRIMPRRERSRLEEEALVTAYYVARDVVGYGPLEPLLRDPGIEDITCNGVGIPVFVFHTEYEWLTTNIVFSSEDELEKIIMKLSLKAGQEPSIATPMVEGVLRPEGYRVHIALDVVSRRGHSFTIRKFRAEPFTIVELIRRRTLDPLVAAFLWMAVQYKQGIVIYGPTGSGKTTLLNALAMLLPPEYKIVTVEDTPEIYLPFHENWTAMITRLARTDYAQNITLQAQVEAALRQRPDIIILGEIRSREAYAFFQALSTGHGGLTTIHAENADVLIRRLSSPPMNVPKSLIAATRLFVRIVRLEYKGQVLRKVIRVDETLGYDPDKDELHIGPRILWRRDDDVWYMRGKSSSLLDAIAESTLMSREELLEDLERRATVLKWAAMKNLDIAAMHDLVRRYMREPEQVYDKILREEKVVYIPQIIED